ncbi:MAG: S4 domain-containing protein, partial [Oscillospiraceae bacterium]
MNEIRLQKVIAESGLCSRRKAEEMIDEGRVKVNGHRANLGQKVDPKKDLILVDGEKLARRNRRQNLYLMLNKPRGYLTAMSDERGRK